MFYAGLDPDFKKEFQCLFDQLSQAGITALQFTAKNLRIAKNTISSINTNSDINIIPNGTGQVMLKGDPTTSMAAATKNYVDKSRSGMAFKSPARLKTASQLPAYTQTGAGFGAQLTANAIGELGLIDDVAVALGDRILVDTQGSSSEVHNGIYTVTSTGSLGTRWILTRSADADESFEVSSGLYVLVDEGITYSNTSWILSTHNPIVVDTTPLTFVKFSGTAQILGANVGTNGQGFLKGKNGDSLEFYKLYPYSNKVSLSLDSNNNNVVIDVAPHNIQIRELAGSPSSDIVGLSDTQTLCNKTLVSPTITHTIFDSNSNHMIDLIPASSAVNRIQLSNGSTGNSPTITAVGDDANIDLNLQAKGTGCVSFNGMKLPTHDGSPNQVLATDGSGIISFVTTDVKTISTATTTTSALTILASVTMATNNTTYLVDFGVVGKRTDSGSESAGWKFSTLVRNNGGILTKVNESKTLAGRDTITWDCQTITSGTTLLIKVIGDNNKTINWLCSQSMISV